MKIYKTQFLGMWVRVIFTDDDTPVIPVVDIESAISYTRSTLRRMVMRNLDIFAKSSAVVTTAQVQKNTNIKQGYETLCLTREGVVMLMARLTPSKISDPDKRQTIIRFINWIGEVIVYVIDRRIKTRLCPFEVVELLSLESGGERAHGVRNLAKDEERSTCTIYRRLRKANGSAFKPGSRTGDIKHPQEIDKILAFKRNHPDAGGTRIKSELACSYSVSKINRLILKVQS